MLRRLLILLALAVLATAQGTPPETLRPGRVTAASLTALLANRLGSAHPPAAVTLRDATVAGPLDLSDWNVPFLLRFEHCVFDGDLTFDHFRTERSLLFAGCAFRGRTRFTEIHLGRDFEATGCRFLATGSDDPVTFLQSAVGDDFSLNGSTFEGAINLRHLDVGRDLYLQDCTFRGRSFDRPSIVDVKLAGAKIGHFLRIDHDLDVNPRLRFSINDCHFDAIFAQVPKGNTEEGEQARMLRMLDDLTYRAEAYDLVEREFKRRGRDDLADGVYVHGQDRALAESSGFDFVRLAVLKFVAGYGRRPALAFAWCLLAILLGAFVFHTQAEEEGRGRRPIGSFWYSLDFFVPLVSVTGKEPEPPKEGFARTYVRIHRLLGWLLLPIALATVSGVVHP